MGAYWSEMMGAAAFCDVCDHIVVRNGACSTFLKCGNSLGCPYRPDTAQVDETSVAPAGSLPLGPLMRAHICLETSTQRRTPDGSNGLRNTVGDVAIATG
jgi:hypothetical protein